MAELPIIVLTFANRENVKCGIAARIFLCGDMSRHKLTGRRGRQVSYGRDAGTFFRDRILFDQAKSALSFDRPEHFSSRRTAR